MQQSTLLVVNTAVTYGRMAVSIVIGLLATRLLLNALGIVDFGLLTALGATGMLGPMITGAMGGASRRFLAFEIGRGDADRLRSVFNTSQAVFAVWALAFLAVGCVLGPTLLEELTIPDDRLGAASWTYYLVLIDLAVGIWRGPYGALLNAHQALTTAAVFALGFSLLNLVSVILLFTLPGDPLVLYAVLLLVARVIFLTAETLLCWRRYPESRPHPASIRLDEAREIGAFAGWSALGFAAFQLRTQGTLIALNALFGPVINGAWGIAIRLDGYQQNVGAALQQVIQPAMTTALGRGDSELFEATVLLASKVTLLAALTVFIPVAIDTEMVLWVWLGEVPPWTVWFVRIALVTTTLFFAITGHGMGLMATGKIGRVTWINLLLNLAAFVVGVGAVALGAPYPWLAPACFLGVVLAQFVIYVTYIGRVIDVRASAWLRVVALPSAAVATVMAAVTLLVHHLLPAGLVRLALEGLLSALTMAVATWKLGLVERERRELRRIAAALKSRLRRGR